MSHTVFLIHGIRTFAELGDNMVRDFKKKGIKLVIAKYGYFDTISFLFPGKFLKRRAIDRVESLIRGEKESNPGVTISVIAHSFGSYIISEALKRSVDIKLNKLILCGSIVDEGFDWNLVANKIEYSNSDGRKIVNDCAVRDVWPILAKTITWGGYGSSGRVGFGHNLVEDRFHDGGHGHFFRHDFHKIFWIPYLEVGELTEGGANFPLPWYLAVLTRFHLKYMIIIVVLLFFYGTDKFPVEMNSAMSNAISFVIDDVDVSKNRFRLIDLARKVGKKYIIESIVMRVNLEKNDGQMVADVVLVYNIYALKNLSVGDIREFYTTNVGGDVGWIPGSEKEYFGENGAGIDVSGHKAFALDFKVKRGENHAYLTSVKFKYERPFKDDRKEHGWSGLRSNEYPMFYSNKHNDVIGELTIMIGSSDYKIAKPTPGDARRYRANTINYEVNYDASQSSFRPIGKESPYNAVVHTWHDIISEEEYVGLAARFQ